MSGDSDTIIQDRKLRETIVESQIEELCTPNTSAKNSRTNFAQSLEQINSKTAQNDRFLQHYKENLDSVYSSKSTGSCPKVEHTGITALRTKSAVDLKLENRSNANTTSPRQLFKERTIPVYINKPEVNLKEICKYGLSKVRSECTIDNMQNGHRTVPKKRSNHNSTPQIKSEGDLSSSQCVDTGHKGKVKRPSAHKRKPKNSDYVVSVCINGSEDKCIERNDVPHCPINSDVSSKEKLESAPSLKSKSSNESQRSVSSVKRGPEGSHENLTTELKMKFESMNRKRRERLSMSTSGDNICKIDMTEGGSNIVKANSFVNDKSSCEIMLTCSAISNEKKDSASSSTDGMSGKIAVEGASKIDKFEACVNDQSHCTYISTSKCGNTNEKKAPAFLSDECHIKDMLETAPAKPVICSIVMDKLKNISGSKNEQNVSSLSLNGECQRPDVLKTDVTKPLVCETDMEKPNSRNGNKNEYDIPAAFLSGECPMKNALEPALSTPVVCDTHAEKPNIRSGSKNERKTLAASSSGECQIKQVLKPAPTTPVVCDTDVEKPNITSGGKNEQKPLAASLSSECQIKEVLKPAPTTPVVCDTYIEKPNITSGGKNEHKTPHASSSGECQIKEVLKPASSTPVVCDTDVEKSNSRSGSKNEQKTLAASLSGECQIKQVLEPAPTTPVVCDTYVKKPNIRSGSKNEHKTPPASLSGECQIKEVLKPAPTTPVVCDTDVEKSNIRSGIKNEYETPASSSGDCQIKGELKPASTTPVVCDKDVEKPNSRSGGENEQKTLAASSSGECQIKQVLKPAATTPVVCDKDVEKPNSRSGWENEHKTLAASLSDECQIKGVSETAPTKPVVCGINVEKPKSRSGSKNEHLSPGTSLTKPVVSGTDIRKKLRTRSATNIEENTPAASVSSEFQRKDIFDPASAKPLVCNTVIEKSKNLSGNQNEQNVPSLSLSGECQRTDVLMVAPTKPVVCDTYMEKPKSKRGSRKEPKTASRSKSNVAYVNAITEVTNKPNSVSECDERNIGGSSSKITTSVNDAAISKSESTCTKEKLVGTSNSSNRTTRKERALKTPRILTNIKVGIQKSKSLGGKLGANRLGSPEEIFAEACSLAFPDVTQTRVPPPPAEQEKLGNPASWSDSEKKMKYKRRLRHRKIQLQNLRALLRTREDRLCACADEVASLKARLLDREKTIARVCEMYLKLKSKKSE